EKDKQCLTIPESQNHGQIIRRHKNPYQEPIENGHKYLNHHHPAQVLTNEEDKKKPANQSFLDFLHDKIIMGQDLPTYVQAEYLNLRKNP
ncbi:18032_t:CDS:1, partial [Acaulospora morrowiae]